MLSSQQLLLQHTPMMNDSQNTLSHLVNEIAHQLRVIIDGKVEPFNLTRQKWVALSILDKTPGIAQIELAERMDIDRSSAGRLLDRMEKNGLIKRRKDALDRRIIRVFIQDEARPMLKQLDGLPDEIKNVAENGLSQEEQRDLLRLLNKVKSNLKVGLAAIICCLDLTEQSLFFVNFV